MRLYKYLHPDRVTVLRDAEIRFSSPIVLNDPFELKPHISAIVNNEHLEAEINRSLPAVLAEEYAKLPLKSQKKLSFQHVHAFVKAQFPKIKSEIEVLANSASSTIQQVMAQKFEEMIGILCLTESPANLLMWAHYADSHQGFVIEFDCEAPFFDQRKGPQDEMRHLRKVIYGDCRPSMILSEIDSFSSFLSKSLDWSYEEEWRMMLPLSQADRVIGDGLNKVHLFTFPRTAIRSVILGCRMAEAAKKNIVGALGTIGDLKNVLCYQASIDDKHYRLKFLPINT